MLPLFASVKTLFKLDSITIDNNVFRLHYRVTVLALVTFTLLVTSYQYIGDPIECMTLQFNVVPPKVMEAYCWTHSTYTHLDKGATVKKVTKLHPNFDESETVKYHTYYQWVCFALFFQAICFYIPRMVWKRWEAGRMKSLVMELDQHVITDTKNIPQLKLLVDYLVSNMHQHNTYALKFFFCEILNFINVIGQIFLVDYFLGGEFTTYGIDFVKNLRQDPANQIDPMVTVFPKVTLCNFNYGGLSGKMQSVEGLCVLSLNVLNEKIYLILWFWFIILAIFSGLSLFYRFAVFTIAKLRSYILCTNAIRTPKNQVAEVAQKCQIGDWFILLLLANNLNPVIYKQLISDLLDEFKKDGMSEDTSTNEECEV